MLDKKITIAKDFLAIKNNDDELMIVLLYNNGTQEPSSDARIMFGDSGPHAVLIKNDDHAIVLDCMSDETLEMLKETKTALITEIEYNEDVLEYNLSNTFYKDDLYKLFEAAEAHHALKSCYRVVLEKINDFDERFHHFIEEELKELQ